MWHADSSVPTAQGSLVRPLHGDPNSLRPFRHRLCALYVFVGSSLLPRTRASTRACDDPIGKSDLQLGLGGSRKSESFETQPRAPDPNPEGPSTQIQSTYPKLISTIPSIETIYTPNLGILDSDGNSSNFTVLQFRPELHPSHAFL